MKTVYRFELESELACACMAMLMAGLFIYWLTLLSLIYRNDDATVGFKVMLCMAGCLLAAKGWRQAAALTIGARVMGKIQAPESLRRSWLHASLVNSTYAWGFFVAGGTLLLALSQMSWHWATPAALFSIILCLATVATLSNYGMLHRAWFWSISIGSFALIVATSWTIGISGGLDLFGGLPILFQLLLAVSWPLLAYGIAFKWGSKQPIGISSISEGNSGVFKRVAAYARRYTPLQASTLGNAESSASFQKSPFRAYVLAMNPVWVLLSLGHQFLIKPWGGQIDVLHLLALAFIATWFSGVIVCKDMHWRMLLAPGGLYHGRIGGHILRSTITLQYTVLLIVTVIGAAVARTVFNVPFHREVELIRNFCILPIELLFVTALAVALRGARHSIFVIVIFIALVIACAGAVLWKYGINQVPKLCVVGPVYVCMLLGATALLTMLSNRLWTIKKLFHFRNWA